MDSGAPSFAERVAAVKGKVGIADLVERHVVLSGRAGARNRRGKCPFHQGNSASFSVQADKGFAHCFGCQWSGDVVKFVSDYFRQPFIEALKDLEREAGIVVADSAGSRRGDWQPRPVERERNPSPGRRRELVEPVEMGRWIWKAGVRDADNVRRYFLGRGVPFEVLRPERMGAFRYLADCPCWLWPEGADPRKVKGMLFAPAVVALVTRPELVEGALAWVPVGVHVTYLSPDGASTMVRRKPWAKADDADPMLPKRRMLGPVGKGAVVLGAYRPDARLFVGEGNETVFSGMVSGGAGADDVGIATLSLDNLQGGARLWKNRTWPLHAIEPDLERPAFLVPGHRGAVVGLIDSDMAPLKDQQVVEQKGGPLVRRAITGAERAQICGELFVKHWRASGVHDVRAIRAPLGMDFNDVMRERAA